MVRGVGLLRGVTGDNEELILGGVMVAAVRIPSRNEIALSQVDRLWTLVTVVLAVLTDDVGQVTNSNHILEGVVQKGVFRLTVLRVVIDATHCLVAWEKPWLYMLNFKPASLGEIFWHRIKRTHCPPHSQQQ